MDETAKKSWGGRRVGAGRKTQENARNIRASFTLSEKAVAALARLAEEQNTTKNDAINRLLESL